MMPGMAGNAAHVLLFPLAAIVFFLGLGVRMQLNPARCMVFWLASGATVVLNLLWFLRWRK